MAYPSRPVSRNARLLSARPTRLRFEELEPRSLPSVTGLGADSVVPLIRPYFLGLTNPYPAAFTVGQIRHAYGFDKLKFPGSSVTPDGSGETIAIVDAYGDPHAADDLRAFDSAMNLPDAPSFVKVDQTGGTIYPKFNSLWGLETSLDLDWAHAAAPGANLLLVEANTGTLGDLLAGVDYARQQPGVVAVSMSWGQTEFSGELADDAFLTTPTGHQGITFVAASGDSGNPALYPGFSPNVLSAGGTGLTLNAQGNYAVEQAWGKSGGGISLYEPQPAFQAGIVTQSTTQRTAPDISSNADPITGLSVYASFTYRLMNGWWQIGGTSAAAPLLAGLIAVADQGRALAGVGSLQNGQAALYSVASTDFHDITKGSRAGVGYDLSTGRGSPMADLLVNDLISASNSLIFGQPPTKPNNPSLRIHPLFADFSAGADPIGLGFLANGGPGSPPVSTVNVTVPISPAATIGHNQSLADLGGFTIGGARKAAISAAAFRAMSGSLIGTDTHEPIIGAVYFEWLDTAPSAAIGGWPDGGPRAEEGPLVQAVPDVKVDALLSESPSSEDQFVPNFRARTSNDLVTINGAASPGGALVMFMGGYWAAYASETEKRRRLTGEGWGDH